MSSVKSTLADICEFINGGAWSDKEYVESGIPVVKVTNMVGGTIDTANMSYLPVASYGKYKQHELHTSDLIVSTVGSHPTQPGSVVGRTSVIPPCLNGAFLNQNAVCVRVKNRELICQKFLIYVAQTPIFKYHIESRARGSANQVRMAIGELKKFTFDFPPLFVQKKIAAVLSAYDDLIENNTRRIALLEKMAEEIYREWFVRLRFPGHEQVTFHKGIPEGWAPKRFDKFCLLQRGYDLPNAKVQSGPYPVLASTSIKTFHNQFKVKPPVITTGRSGSLGTVLLVNEPAWPLNTTLFVKKTFGNSHYLICYTLKFLRLENFNSGAGVPTLNRNHLGGLKLSVPPKALQDAFDEKIAVIFQQQESLEKSTEVLNQTRDRLLTRLISGKLSVEDLGIYFPPSMTAEVPHDG
jgi:type I restriction enzyme S subunit